MTTARLKDDKDAKAAGWVVGILLLGALGYFIGSSHQQTKDAAANINGQTSSMQTTVPNPPNLDPTRTSNRGAYTINPAETAPQVAGKYNDTSISH